MPGPRYVGVVCCIGGGWGDSAERGVFSNKSPQRSQTDGWGSDSDGRVRWRHSSVANTSTVNSNITKLPTATKNTASTVASQVSYHTTSTGAAGQKANVEASAKLTRTSYTIDLNLLKTTCHGLFSSDFQGQMIVTRPIRGPWPPLESDLLAKTSIVRER